MNVRSNASTLTKAPATFIKWLAAGILLINLFVVVLAGFSLRHSKLQHEERVAVTTQNLAQVLEEYIDGSFDKIDILLLAAVDEIESQLAGGGINRQELNSFLARRSALLPELAALRMLNAQGEIGYGTGLTAGTSTSAADRDYFIRFRNDPNAGLFISKPLVSRISGKWVIMLARRVNRHDGSFAGVVYGVVPLEHFLKLFTSIDVGKHGAISLRDGAMEIIVRYPEPRGIGSSIGQKTVPSEFQTLLRTGRNSGTFKASSPVDNIERTYSYRKVSGYPLYINVGLATSDYLADWRGEVAKMSAIVALFLIITLFASRLVYHDWKRKKAVVLELMQQETKFRTIADYTYDWEFWLSPEGKFIHVSPSCKRITGYDAEAFYADPQLMFRIVHPDDYPQCAVHHHGTQAGQSDDSLVVRIRHTDGSYRWLEHVCQPIVDESGTFLGTRGSNRDITARKRAEERLAELNDCLLSFGADSGENIDCLVALCGEQLGAACALYNRLEGETLHAVGQWRTPPDFVDRDLAEGHICYDVIRSSEENVTVVRDLQHTEYAKTDPNVTLYGFQTYVGKAVSFGGSYTGSLCVVYQEDRIPGEEDKKLLGIIASAIGVEEERMRAVDALREGEATLRSITTSARDAIIMIDHQGQISFWNEAAAQIFGWEEEEALGSDLHLILMPDGYQEAYLLGMQHFSGTGTGNAIGKTLEFQAMRKDKTEIPVEVSLSAVQLKGQWHAVGIIRDITERKRVEAEIEHMAFHDALTGLPNRLLLNDRLNQAIAHASRAGHMTAVLFFDLDNFKAINDTLGHPMGDRLLKCVVERLKNRMRESDTLARMGGDEFIIVLTDVRVPEDAANAARKLLGGISYPFELDGREFFITASIGISLFPIDGLRNETLLKNADIAMFQAKKQGWNSFQFYTEEINRQAEKRHIIETELRQAVLRGEFMLHYQPWMDLKTGRIGGMEALIRWVHPQHGLILPAHFIPIAEETGLIIQIGEWVMRNACHFLKELHQAGLTDLTMSVNVSGKQLRSPDLIGLVGLVLAEVNLHPSYLELELTESSVMENVEESCRYMDALKIIGVRFALDDFGTGYSSLNYLKRFPLDRLKIDRSFVRDCPANLDDVAIARAVIALAHSLNLQVTAEGVETMEQADFFRREGCLVIQGHLIGKPMPGSELREVLNEKTLPF
jgi:diguanylate cyclase (GGDEF)-like protein/PAS domain S-box-containing protein